MRNVISNDARSAVTSPAAGNMCWYAAAAARSASRPSGAGASGACCSPMRWRSSSSRKASPKSTCTRSTSTVMSLKPAWWRSWPQSARRAAGEHRGATPPVRSSSAAARPARAPPPSPRAVASLCPSPAPGADSTAARPACPRRRARR